MERFSGTPNTQFIVNVERTVTDPYSDKLKTSRAALKANWRLRPISRWRWPALKTPTGASFVPTDAHRRRRRAW